MKESNNIPLLDCPKDYLIGDASGKVMNEYGRFPCKIQCGVYAIMVRGEARATINITEHRFRQNDMLLLEPGSFLLIHEFSEDALVYYIVFSSSFLEKNAFSTPTHMSLTSLQMPDPILHLPADVASVTIHMIDVLVEACNCQPSLLSSSKMLHVFTLLQNTYAEMARESQQPAAHPLDRKNEIFHDYCQLVMKHYREWHHVTQYADAMRLTLPHLSATIKQVSNKTAGDLIIEAILTDAKAQLRLTTLQIKEIAISIGFENVAFFNRFFKSHTGYTPKAYRLAAL
ncbi:MAG: AraC family transcriptional regulator [Paludibacteraceae bacterium]|nr:AraC family transcriptional regulator [Paludibacteraceae bacterium]